MSQLPVKALLSIEEASSFLSVKVSRLRTAVFRKEIPFVKIGRLVRFKQDELIKWIDSKTVKADEEDSSWLW
ncbi:DNA binding domain protein, excisionase family [Halobacteriovorax sp. BALOs_7]|uniref:helix-turn-helix domain-containing protein n=1 Tax=Halobacteriovorax sp. BALOs_7 TaxID=2109558 RepID=UPI000EA0E629|nr:helix-turn-helix domain-containing protein [Halobacteriovorax sp. BALOs_7]AYF43743.1 DNA binding domain protein, excisionase family [Halobacteriovorax sp. BALOs_7]